MMSSKDNIEEQLRLYKLDQVERMGGVDKLLEIAMDIYKHSGQPIETFQERLDEHMTRNFMTKIERNTFTVEIEK